MTGREHKRPRGRLHAHTIARLSCDHVCLARGMYLAARRARTTALRRPTRLRRRRRSAPAARPSCCGAPTPRPGRPTRRRRSRARPPQPGPRQRLQPAHSALARRATWQAWLLPYAAAGNWSLPPAGVPIMLATSGAGRCLAPGTPHLPQNTAENPAEQPPGHRAEAWQPGRGAHDVWAMTDAWTSPNAWTAGGAACSAAERRGGAPGLRGRRRPADALNEPRGGRLRAPRVALRRRPGPGSCARAW
jgi:hypothetical protein